jgi:tetratricopeptide (TPR) repeat protein
MFKEFEMLIRSLQFAAAAAFVACSALLAQAQSLDSVYTTKGGAPSKGTITDAMTKDSVTLDMAGVPRVFQIGEIARITYGDEPQELANARNSVVAKNYGSAIEELKKIPAGSLIRPHMLQDAQYYLALCQVKLAMTEGQDRTKAETDMLNFVRTAPNSYHFYEAAEMLGDLAMSGGKYDAAVKFYTPLTRAPAEDTQMKANNAVARALVAQKEFAKALTNYEAVLASGLATAEATNQKMLATVGKAQCLGETGKPDEGVKMLEEVIAKNDPQDAKLFARTYNALGSCHLKAGRDKDALLAFLHTDVLFYADGEAHAEALYHLVKLWTAMNKADRATAARGTLKDRYAGSVWNAKE